MSPKKEHRKYVRYPVDLDVEVYFECPSMAFPPQTKLAKVLDIEEKGMSLSVKDVPVELHRVMEEECHFVDIKISFPHNKKINKLLGKVIWSSYDPETHKCKIGIHLESLSPDHLQNMRELTSLLEQKKGS